MAPSDLDRELRRRAETAAQAVLRNAEVEAERIAAEVDEAIENRRTAALSTREEQCRAQARAAIANARREAMRTLLLAKTALVDRVLERAKAELPAVAASATYRATLPHDVGRALQFVEAEGTVVRCAPALADAIRDAVGETPGVRVEAAEDLGSGFMVVGRDGAVVVDARLQTRLERLAPTLAIEIHEQVDRSSG